MLLPCLASRAGPLVKPWPACIALARGGLPDHRPDRPAGRPRHRAVVEPGLPAGHRTPRATEPEDPHGAAGHPRLLDGGTHRAGCRCVRREAEEAGRGRPCRGPRHAASQTRAHRPARAMTGTVDDEAVTDPVGLVVRLVRAVESSLGTEQIRDVVSRTAGGRAKRRRPAPHPGTGSGGAHHRRTTGVLGSRPAPVRSAVGRRDLDRCTPVRALWPHGQLHDQPGKPGLLALSRHTADLRQLRRTAPSVNSRPARPATLRSIARPR